MLGIVCVVSWSAGALWEKKGLLLMTQVSNLWFSVLVSNSLNILLLCE